MDPLNTLPLQPPGAGLACMKGIRVVDFTTSVAGSYGTRLLADLGADVIKVEKRDGGDDTRRWGPFLGGDSLWFLSINRNKRSFTIDLTRPEGRSVAQELVRIADVVVLNADEAVQHELGLDYPTLKVMKPKLIHVSVTSAGLTQECTALSYFDLIASDCSAFLQLTGEADRLLRKGCTPSADLLAGQDFANATVAALFECTRTGSGKQIEVSTAATMARFMSSRVIPRPSSGDTDSIIGISHVFETADRPIILCLENEAILKRFWTAVGCPNDDQPVRFETDAKRRDARHSLVQTVSDLLLAKPLQHWLTVFAEHRIPAGPLNSITQLANDFFPGKERFFLAVQGAGRPVLQVDLGIQFEGDNIVFRSPPPALGQDTERILKEELSMSAACIAGLIDSAIV